MVTTKFIVARYVNVVANAIAMLSKLNIARNARLSLP